MLQYRFGRLCSQGADDFNPFWNTRACRGARGQWLQFVTDQLHRDCYCLKFQPAPDPSLPFVDTPECRSLCEKERASMRVIEGTCDRLPTQEDYNHSYCRELEQSHFSEFSSYQLEQCRCWKWRPEDHAAPAPSARP